MPDVIGHALRDRLDGGAERFDVRIVLREESMEAWTPEAALAAPSREEAAGARRAAVAEAKRRTETSQAPLLAWLGERTGESTIAPAVESFWINNTLAAVVDRATLVELAGRDDVEAVLLHRTEELAELIGPTAGEGEEAPVEDVEGGPQAASHLTVVGAPTVWAEGIDGRGALVAVIDTGVAYDHPDLEQRMWRRPGFPNHGWNFESDDDDPRDDDGHGTACAGLVAGDGTAGTRTGVAPGATIMALRVGGDEDHFWRAFQFAIDHDADVISMSMSWKHRTPFPDRITWRRACEGLLRANLAHANSAGNEGAQLGSFPLPHNMPTPANCPPPWLHPDLPVQAGRSSAVAVGAVDGNGALLAASGRGPAAWAGAIFPDYPYDPAAPTGLTKPDVCAPGASLRTLSRQHAVFHPPRPYRSFSGTSAATPVVAGSMALLVSAALAAGRAPLPARVLEALERTALPIAGQGGKENDRGSGRIDVAAAHRYGSQRGWW